MKLNFAIAEDRAVNYSEPMTTLLHIKTIASRQITSYCLLSCCACVLLVFLPGCGIGQDVGIEVFGGDDNLSLVKAAKNVKAFLVVVPEEEIGPGAKPMEIYSVVTGPIDVPRNIASQLTTIFSSRDTYYWNAGKSCLLQPSVRIQYSEDDSVIDVFLCFECEILLVYRDGKCVGGEAFDYGRASIVRLLKQLFESNPTIQGLSETRN